MRSRPLAAVDTGGLAVSQHQTIQLTVRIATRGSELCWCCHAGTWTRYFPPGTSLKELHAWALMAVNASRRRSGKPKPPQVGWSRPSAFIT